jgi:Protein of unknown function (DUF2878)
MSREQLKVWANFIAYEVVWFVTVYSAGRDRTLPGVLAVVVFACMQLTVSHQRAADLRLIVAAVLVGMVLDGVLAATGVVEYNSTPPALPPGGAPIWILALWASFALTLNHSLRWLRGRPLGGAVLGAIGGPLAYISSNRLSGAVVLATPQWRALLCLAFGWSLAIGLLAYLAGRWAETFALTPPVTRECAP